MESDDYTLGLAMREAMRGWSQPKVLYGSVAEAAARYAVTSKTIREWIADGTLPAYRLGSRIVRINFAEADEQLLRKIEPGDKS